MGYSLVCPACRGKFPWVPTEGMPDRCSLCKAVIGNDRADDDIVMPFISKATGRTPDKLYRDMERGSEIRAQVAAEMTGASVSEMSGLKITDMGDRRDSEVLAKTADDAMTRLASSTKTPIGFQPNGAEMAAGVNTGAVMFNGQVTHGVEPRAGMNALGKIQRSLGRG